MAYSTSNPPVLLTDGGVGGGSMRIWCYESTDASTVVDADGYITNAADLGMQAGDLVIVRDTDASPTAVTSHVVSAINSNGSADLSDGVSIGVTDSD